MIHAVMCVTQDNEKLTERAVAELMTEPSDGVFSVKVCLLLLRTMCERISWEEWILTPRLERNTCNTSRDVASPGS